MASSERGVCTRRQCMYDYMAQSCCYVLRQCLPIHDHSAVFTSFCMRSGKFRYAHAVREVPHPAPYLAVKEFSHRAL